MNEMSRVSNRKELELGGRGGDGAGRQVGE